MANTTFKGPVRSQNGFQEWNGSAWVPVAGGGGGGGTTLVELTLENLYSNDSNSPVASPGNTLQLPLVGVGETITIMPWTGSGGFGYAWKLQLPAVSGVDLTTYVDTLTIINPYNSEYQPTVYSSYLLDQGPSDYFYLYGQLRTPLQFIRGENTIVPGFGSIAFFSQFGTCGVRVLPLPDPTVYPYTSLIP